MKDIFVYAIISSLIGAGFLWAAWTEYKTDSMSRYATTLLFAGISLLIGLGAATGGLLGFV